MKLLLSPQEGQSSVYFIICIMVVLLAVSLVGGFGTLMSGDTPFPVADTPEPSQSISVSPSNSSGNWDLSFDAKGCAKEKIPVFTGILTASGTGNGYISLEIQDNNSFKQILTSAFNSPKTTYNMILSSQEGFDTKNWRIVIYSGGKKTNDQWTDGQEQKNYNGNKTECNN